MKDKITFKPSTKMKLDDVGEYLAKVSRGTGAIPNRKKESRNFRKEKHKNKYI